MKKDTKSTSEDNKILEFPWKKDNKKARSYRGVILFVILVVAIWVCLFSGDSSFNYTNTVNVEPIALSTANNYDFTSYKGGYILAKDGKISCYNTNQQLQWETTSSKTSPTIKVNENYALVYYNSDNLAVVTNGEKTRKIKTSGNVLYGYVNTNGSCVLLLKESGLKNKIVVYNKNGEIIYYRDNPDKHITYALLSDDNKTLITSELITSGDSISTELVVTNVNKNEVKSTIKFENEIPGGYFLTDKRRMAVIFESSMKSFDLDGKLKWETKFENKSAFRFSYDGGIFAFVFNDDDSANTGSEAVFYNRKGKKIGSYKTDQKIRGIDIFDKTVLMTMDRQLIMVNTKGKHISTSDVTYDMKNSFLMGTKKCALIISNSRDARLVPLAK